MRRSAHRKEPTEATTLPFLGRALCSLLSPISLDRQRLPQPRPSSRCAFAADVLAEGDNGQNRNDCDDSKRPQPGFFNPFFCPSTMTRDTKKYIANGWRSDIWTPIITFGLS